MMKRLIFWLAFLGSSAAHGQATLGERTLDTVLADMARYALPTHASGSNQTLRAPALLDSRVANHRFKAVTAAAALAAYEGAAFPGMGQRGPNSARTAPMPSGASLPAPFAASDLYGFVFPTSVRLAADDTKWIVGGDYGGAVCDEPEARVGEAQGRAFCRIGERLEKSEYDLHRSAGSKQTVTKVTGDWISLAIPVDQLRKAGFQKVGHRTAYTLTRSINQPQKQVSSGHSDELEVMLVGSLTGSSVIKGRRFSARPTTERRSDVFVQDKGLPFHLTSVIFYRPTTGEILDEIQVR